jgi:phage portal protein BeeE
MPKNIINNANSLGLIEGYFGVPYAGMGILDGRKPKFDSKKALNVIENDPVVKAAIITLVDKTLESGWRITGLDKRSRKKELENKLKDLRFDAILRKTLYNLFLYNNAFIEIVKKGDSISDLNVLETTLMEIQSDDFGNIKGYKQDALAGRLTPHWNPDQVCHIKLRDITTNVWASPLDIQSLYETAQLKDYIRQWMTWFFGTNQLRGLYAIESGASDARVKDFVSYLKASEKDKTKPIILQGKVVYQMLNTFNEGDKIMQVMEWCDRQMLMLLQVPPIAVGQPDSSGRSNSVEQFQALNTTILSVQKILEEYFTYDLFKKIGYDKVVFDFGIVDQSARVKAFEIAEKMKTMMMTDEVIQEFLESQGIVFSTEKLFKDKEEILELSGKMLGPQKQYDNAPSRQRQDASSNSTLSKANTQTMVKNSIEDKYSKYPYVYEAKE